MLGEKPLTRHFRSDGEALSFDEYRKVGGYEAADIVLGRMSPKEIQDIVKAANLRGRGGAGFITGLKWSFVPMGPDAGLPKYLAANADEMEPGTFKDRILMEGNPHLFIEGMIIAAYAIGANIAYIFLRAEYKKSQLRLEKAIAEAYQNGHLGKNIKGSGHDLEMILHTSAGRYMCGEETGLLNSLEGKRPNPRSKPPYPQTSGLWGRPTVVQNVETLCNVPLIIKGGAEWYKSLSKIDEGGTKIFGASGKVNRPGWWELPMGTTAREILEEYAGGMRDGLKFRGLLPGGASTDFIIEKDLDTPLGFGTMGDTGSRLGTGTMLILDDQTCPIGLVRNIEKFMARESCGWCTPCRDGLPWVYRILTAFEEGDARPEEIGILEEHCKWLGPGNTYCALAPGAVEPLQSALKYFRDDFERHIRDKRCTYK
jgi:NADH-quinone oxidoreductase subunit F